MLGSLAVAKSVLTDQGLPVVDLMPLVMKQVAGAEVEHFQGRNRCVEHLRKTLTAEQPTQLYLDGLR